MILPPTRNRQKNPRQNNVAPHPKLPPPPHPPAIEHDGASDEAKDSLDLWERLP